MLNLGPWRVDGCCNTRDGKHVVVRERRQREDKRPARH